MLSLSWSIADHYWWLCACGVVRDVLALLDASKSHGSGGPRFRVQRAANALGIVPKRVQHATLKAQRHQLLKLRAKNPELFKVQW